MRLRRTESLLIVTVVVWLSMLVVGVTWNILFKHNKKHGQRKTLVKKKTFLQGSHNLAMQFQVTTNEYASAPKVVEVQLANDSLSTYVTVSDTTMKDHTHVRVSIAPILQQADIDSVRTFIFFVGWSRSCHSIIGSMIDAHPNALVAHEYSLFKKLSQDQQLSNKSSLFQALYKNSYRNAATGWRTASMVKKGYSLNMNGSWQGRFDELRVIGDKSGGNVADKFAQSAEKFKVLYQQLTESVQVPIKVLHIIRNPFDMIATQTLFRASKLPQTKVNATVSHKHRNFTLLNSVTDYFLKRTRGIFHMVSELKLSPLEVHCEDLISHPAETMSTICQFLGLECSREYLQMCVEKTFKNVSASRHLVEWDPATLPSLKRNIAMYPFFQRYT